MKIFVMRDEFIGESKIGYEVMFFELEDGCESIVEEDIFDGSKSNEMLVE